MDACVVRHCAVLNEYQAVHCNGALDTDLHGSPPRIVECEM